MNAEKKTFGLTGNQLKLFALIVMTIDHIGCFLLPDVVFLRVIGRLAMPVFAWMIAEGCTYTKNRTRYLLTMLGFGFVCQIVYLVFMKSITQCIFITFSMSIMLIYVLDFANRKRSFWSLCLLGVVAGAICYICVFLPRHLRGFNVDYSIYGVLLPVVIYLGRTKAEKLLLAAGCLTVLAMGHGHVQWYAVLSLPILALYNGKRGKMPLKYLFYFYYPLHLVAIYGIGLVITRLK